MIRRDTNEIFLKRNYVEKVDKLNLLNIKIRRNVKQLLQQKTFDTKRRPASKKSVQCYVFHIYQTLRKKTDFDVDG